MTDTYDYAANIGQYVQGAVDEAAIAGIVKHLGIALRPGAVHGADARFVACSDASERDRVRDSFLEKKLARSEADAELDAAVRDVCETMHAEREKHRVTFYYLLAERYGKLGDLH